MLKNQIDTFRNDNAFYSKLSDEVSLTGIQNTLEVTFLY